MSKTLDILFTRTWWEYDPHGDPFTMGVCHWFNIIEGCAWAVFAILVLWRFLSHQKPHLELWYALAFFTFAGSDFREAWILQSWLVWFKLVNLVVLLVLRRTVMSRYYPDAKVF